MSLETEITEMIEPKAVSRVYDGSSFFKVQVEPCCAEADGGLPYGRKTSSDHDSLAIVKIPTSAA